METFEIPADSGALLILDAPKGTNFGLDYVEWKVTDKFRGIQGIPPGVHFVYTSPANKPGEFTARLGFFIDIRPREVVVRRWDPYLEYLVECTDAKENERFQQGVLRGDFKTRMGPYPTDHREKWQSLSNYITPSTLEKVAPVKALMASSALHEEKKRGKKEGEGAKMDEDEKEPLPKSDKGQDGDSENAAKRRSPPPRVDETSFRAFYTDVPSTRTQGITPGERTKRGMETGRNLEVLLAKYTPGNEAGEIAGELQFAFVSFLLGQCFDGLEQWKLLTNLLCNSTEGLTGSRPDLLLAFVEILGAQLSQLPEDFFTDDMLEGNFLEPSLRALFAGLLARSPCPADLVTRVSTLRATAEKRFGLKLPECPAAFLANSLTPAPMDTGGDPPPPTDELDGLQISKNASGVYTVVDEDGNEIPVVM